MPRIVDLGRTRLLWVPGDTGIEDHMAPTTAELELGRDLTCMMVSTYEVRMDGSDTTNERAVCETNNVTTPPSATTWAGWNCSATGTPKTR